MYDHEWIKFISRYKLKKEDKDTVKINYNDIVIPGKVWRQLKRNIKEQIKTGVNK